MLEDGPIDEDELDGAGDVDCEASIGWPADFTAKLNPEMTYHAGADCEGDHSDFEDDELGDEHAPAPVDWVFGPKRARAVEAEAWAAQMAACL